MIKKILITQVALLLLMLGSGNLFAQEFKIKGTVSDRTTNETIPSVTISVKEKVNTTTTGIDGSFELTVDSDKVTIQFRHISYKTLSYEVSGKSGSVINIGNIALDPNIVDLDEVKIISSLIISIPIR